MYNFAVMHRNEPVAQVIIMIESVTARKCPDVEGHI